MIIKHHILSIVFMIIAMIGSFYFGNYLTSPNIKSQNLASYSSAFEQAKKEIPPPELPPKPAGQTVTTIIQQKVTVPTTRVVNESQKLGPLGLNISVPKIITEQKEITQEVPSTKLIDASPEQIDKWNAQVKKIQENYNNAINERAKDIEAKNVALKRAELIENAKNLTKDVIVPLITALTGLIGAIAALRWGRRASSSR